MTLIEVVLGLAIFLMAIVAISQLTDFGLDRAMEATLQADGTRLAQSKLAEVEAGVISPASGGSGTFDNDEQTWSWTVDSVPSPMTIPNLYTVTVTVTHDFNGKPFTVTLSQMVYDPAYGGTGALVVNPVTGTSTLSSTTTSSSSTSGGTSP
jgi:hypothetical protein